MTVGKKRPIRRRVWASDDKAEARDVGENLRDVAQSLSALPSIRAVTIANQFYTDGGIVFSSTTRPIGIVNVYSETVDGQASTAALSGMAFDKGVCTVKLGLTPGTRYTTIRLLVIG